MQIPRWSNSSRLSHSHISSAIPFLFDKLRWVHLSSIFNFRIFDRLVTATSYWSQSFSVDWLIVSFLISGDGMSTADSSSGVDDDSGFWCFVHFIHFVSSSAASLSEISSHIWNVDFDESFLSSSKIVIKLLMPIKYPSSWFPTRHSLLWEISVFAGNEIVLAKSMSQMLALLRSCTNSSELPITSCVRKNSDRCNVARIAFKRSMYCSCGIFSKRKRKNG